jgi:hypothetical protein
MGSVSINAYAVEAKKIGIGNLTEDDLVAAWYFDEDSGDVVKDYKGNYDGNINGATKIDTPYGKGMTFDGVDDYIQFSDKVIPVGEKTIRFKMKVSKAKEHEQVIFSNINDGRTQKGIHAIVHTSGKLYIQFYDGYDFLSISTPYSICDNKWHDILFTWDGSADDDRVKLYDNNTTIPVSTITSKIQDVTSYTLNLSIGKIADAPDKFFDGELGEIQVYNEYYTPPSTPVNLIAESSHKKVNLSWDEVESADKYIVKRSTTKGGPYEKIGETKETSYTDSGLENGTTYYYVVCAVKNGVKSPDSNEASAIPEGSSSGGDNALLRITMLNGTINEYDLSMSDVEDFIDWFEDRDDPYYIIEKDYNIGPFESRKDYIVADKILQFEVMEYND